LCMHLLNHGACVTFMLIIGRHIHECMAVAMS
jgi:hypothetical protein